MCNRYELVETLIQGDEHVACVFESSAIKTPAASGCMS